MGGVLRREPLRAIAGEPACRHQQMHVRMVQQGPRPGVRHAQAAETAPEMAGIARELLQGRGGTPIVNVIDGVYSLTGLWQRWSIPMRRWSWEALRQARPRVCAGAAQAPPGLTARDER